MLLTEIGNSGEGNGLREIHLRKSYEQIELLQEASRWNI